MSEYTSTHTGQEIDAYATKQQLINLIYPVGSIYISVNSTSPATLFGGTWEQITGRFLLGSSDTYTAGSVGGEATHTLTNGELPALHGTAWCGNFWGNSKDEAPNHANGIFSLGPNGNEEYTYPTGWAADTAGRRPGLLSINFGGNQAHNNMPPYLAVNIWKRIS